MFVDKRNEFCDALALNTGAANTYVIGDQIDLGVARDVGNGEPIYLTIVATTGVNAASAGTVQFQLVTADNANTRKPASAATITSGTVDIPTTSPPMRRKKRYSARVS